MRWNAGDVVVRRDIWAGKPWHAIPGIVVEDSGDRLITFVPAGSDRAYMIPNVEDTPAMFAALQQGEWDLGLGKRYNHTLAINTTGHRSSVLLFWTPSWEFISWYVNIEAPFVRTAIGYDSTDWHLDVVLEPQTEPRWKDEHHMELAVELGMFTADEYRAMRDEGNAVIERYRFRRSPFDEPWPDWRPPWSEWAPARLPDGWQDVPASDHERPSAPS
jgi:hypothetical protein